ncbi:hypothetical protein V6N13_149755 [Hibiscus sabdariffa]
MWKCYYSHPHLESTTTDILLSWFRVTCQGNKPFLNVNGIDLEVLGSLFEDIMTVNYPATGIWLLSLLSLRALIPSSAAGNRCAVTMRVVRDPGAIPKSLVSLLPIL